MLERTLHFDSGEREIREPGEPIRKRLSHIPVEILPERPAPNDRPATPIELR